MNTQINERDLVSMKLLHYFITKKNYTPIIVQGVENEIWLENLDGEYKVIRIVNGYIHNNEQLDFDAFKTQRMVKKIKKKTFSFNIKTLNILTDVGENVDRSKTFPNVDIVYFEDEKKIVKNDIIKKSFPDLKDNLEYTEDGLQLFFKITDEINNKNRKDAMETDQILEPKTPYITIGMLTFIILLFLVSVVTNSGAEIKYYFCDYGPFIRNGEIYRLLTSSFIHIDIIPLIFNAYALYIVGTMIEGYYGKKKYAIIYFVSAISGSLLSIAMSDVPSIGASGAIFGLLGSLLYFGYHYRVYFGSVILGKVIPVVIFNLAIGFMFPEIDNFGHIGGLIGGFLVSKALGINSKDKTSDKVNGIVMTVLYVGFLVVLGIFMR
jgi:rhomboid protease GluP